VMYAGGPSGDPTWGLMGNVAQPSPMMGLMGPQQVAQNQNFQGGPWSQLAYQMAGSPNQNPFGGMTLPPASATAPAGGGATGLGGAALGILGALAQNPSTTKSVGSTLSNLLGSGSSASGATSKLGSLFGSGASTAGSTAAANAATSASAAPAGLFTSGTADTTAGLGGITTAFGDGAAGPAVGTTTTFGDAAGADAAGTTTTFGDTGGGLLGSDAAATDAGATAGGEAGGGAAAGSSSGLGAGAGLAAAIAPLAITAELAMHTHAVQLGDDYWKKYSNPTGTYGSGAGNYTQNFLELANGINQGDMPPDYLLAQYPGLYQAAAQLHPNGPMSAYWGTGGSHGPISQNRA
jgi:hypothetical protein